MIQSIQIREEEHLELLLGYAASAGYKDVSISFGSTDILMKDDYKKSVEKIAGLLDKNGLKCIQTHLPCYHLLVSSEVIEEEMETAIKRGIEESAVLGAGWAAFHPRTAVNDGYNRSKSFEENKKMLTEYLEYAEKSGVGIAVENMPLYPYGQPGWRFFGGGYEELCELCDSFKSDKIGICWDFGHAHTAALDQPAALETVGDRLKITHVHDNYKNGDHHLLPLQGSTEWGCIEWEKVMPALREINYTGPMTLEIIYPPVPMLESFVNHSYDCVSHLIKLSE